MIDPSPDSSSSSVPAKDSISIQKLKAQAQAQMDKGLYHISSKEIAAGLESPPLNEPDVEIDLRQMLNTAPHDAADMRRMGKKQQLNRNFRVMSMLSFTTIVQATWEFVIVSMYQGLLDGGRAGMVWGFVWTVVGFGPIIFSLAEMASMAPTSGGQYHWVSEFASGRFQKILSYMSGWQATMSWQAGCASGPFVTGTLMQALVASNSNYQGTTWQGTLIVIANVLLVYVTNVYLTRFIPLVQNTVMVIHIFLFFAFVIPLWILAPHASTSDVFTTTFNGGNWPNIALGMMVGQISSIYGIIGSDAAAHMSEETQDAGVTVPAAMVGSYVINGILGIVTIITVCYAIPDVQAATDSQYPHLYAMSNAMSFGWLVVINIFIMVVIFASNVSFMASTARETFAFARDRGLPGGLWISKVNKKSIPENSLMVSALISIALSLIYIGSNTAFYAIVSLNVVALMATYFLSIGCILWRRVYHPSSLPKARWSLGRYGIITNVAGLAYSLWAFFWSFWPQQLPVTSETFNWSVVMFLGVTIFSLVLYGVQGRHHYQGPVTLVEGRRSEFRTESVGEGSAASALGPVLPRLEPRRKFVGNVPA